MPVYCQEAANPDYYSPRDVPREYDVSFVGAAYGNRPQYMRSLAAARVVAHAWGPGWSELAARSSSPAARLHRTGSQLKRRILGRPQRPPLLPTSMCGGLLSDSDMVGMFSRSKLSLGFSGVTQGSGSVAAIRQVRLRDFEVPMSGGFYLLEYLEEIEEFFVPGKEIACFQGPHDLVAQVRYYLNHEDERERVRTAGRARAIKDHTWQKRLTDAFKEMGLADDR